MLIEEKTRLDAATKLKFSKTVLDVVINALEVNYYDEATTKVRLEWLQRMGLEGKSQMQIIDMVNNFNSYKKYGLGTENWHKLLKEFLGPDWSRYKSHLLFK